jgi:hypothetical protein
MSDFHWTTARTPDEIIDAAKVYKIAWGIDSTITDIAKGLVHNYLDNDAEIIVVSSSETENLPFAIIIAAFGTWIEGYSYLISVAKIPYAPKGSLPELLKLFDDLSAKKGLTKLVLEVNVASVSPHVIQGYYNYGFKLTDEETRKNLPHLVVGGRDLGSLVSRNSLATGKKLLMIRA